MTKHYDLQQALSSMYQLDGTYIHLAHHARSNTPMSICLQLATKRAAVQSYLNAYDCEEDTTRPLDFYWYSGNMGGGEGVALRTNMNDEPRSIALGSGDELLIKIACGKK